MSHYVIKFLLNFFRRFRIKIFMNEIKRGFVSTDCESFDTENLNRLRYAGEEIYFLLNRSYSIKSAVTFVGNHYQLSERQRTALSRIISPEINILIRKYKELSDDDMSEKTIHIDGFNIIITLETALSESTIFKCMDGTIRDLAGLGGSYRFIDKTNIALQALSDAFENLKIKKAVFYLDSPVSNSGRLKQKIIETLSGKSFEVEAFTETNVDSILEKKGYVISSDAIILDKCQSWYNLTDYILRTSDKLKYVKPIIILQNLYGGKNVR